MKLNCSMCGSDRYVVVSIKPGKNNRKPSEIVASDNFYEQKNQCLKCNTVTNHVLDYDSGKNKYRYINVGGVVNQFHRFVYELVNRKLKPGERVTFRNGNKGDCRPSNLEAIMPKKKKEKKVATPKILVCAREVCLHVWRMRGQNPPETCPKCRSRNWRKEKE